MLSALQLDNERYSRLKAAMDLHLSRAGVRLRLIEGWGHLRRVATGQAQFGLEHYESLLSEGWLKSEQDALTNMGGDSYAVPPRGGSLATLVPSVSSSDRRFGRQDM